MNHIQILKNTPVSQQQTDFVTKATGKFYTPRSIATQLYQSLLKQPTFNSANKLAIADPFAGDGRLIYWFIEACNAINKHKKWEVYLFDINNEGLVEAEKNLDRLRESGISIDTKIVHGDAFKVANEYLDSMDIVITNPPWEMIKPDSRELKLLGGLDTAAYMTSLREYDYFLTEKYPLSQPQKKFAGWGTNLSRVGIEVSYRMLKSNGIACLVTPASFFADTQSLELRRELFTNTTILEMNYFPAEAKLFGKADVASSTMLLKKQIDQNSSAQLTIFDKSLHPKSTGSINLHQYANDGYTVPITIGVEALDVLNKIKKTLPSWYSLENEKKEFWAGREIDETGSKKWLNRSFGSLQFIKGRMVNRYNLNLEENLFANKPGYKFSESTQHSRIAWRDVSRPSQKRRMISTIIPKNTVAGNSLGIVRYISTDDISLFALLGIMNSLCFEFQLKFHLATGHVSLSALRKVHLPSQRVTSKLIELAMLCKEAVAKTENTEAKIEALVASQVYRLSKDDFDIILKSFDKLSAHEVKSIKDEFDKLNKVKKVSEDLIHNHLSSKLSDLDMQIVRSVPQGGNWKNIPEGIPSMRIKQIRQSYAEGKGSRSTYYGRLRPNEPSYTINTYFNRPGNGCHIHYSQDRVLSQREAARLQSFPDNFIFSGPQSVVNNQIGNAVPPLLAFQIAIQIENAIGSKGVFIDLFSGAGGMGLGFKWAGWTPLLASDIEPRFLETYAKNIHERTLCGSISDSEFFIELIRLTKEIKRNISDRPFWVLGGPPCQGFSTAGKKRTMDDERNLLFRHYKKLIEEVSPDGFVFENVAGLLSMEKGKVFDEVKQEFSAVMPNQTGWVLNSEAYAIPQRRKRVILVGARSRSFNVSPPEPLTHNPHKHDLFDNLKGWVSVEDALSDLPALEQGQNGSHLGYIAEPKTQYQKLMRGLISAEEYLSGYKG